MKKIHILTLAALLALTVSCSKTINKEYNANTATEDIKAIVENKEADTTEAVTISMYIVRAQMMGEDLKGKTYKDMLEEAKKIQKKNGVEAAQ